MALIECPECGRQISDRARSCPGCGLPLLPNSAEVAREAAPNEPTAVSYSEMSDTFTGTMALLIQLAIRAISDLGWKVDQADVAVGLVTFQTGGMSWNSWSGISGSLYIQEVRKHTFRVSGTAKPNPSGDIRLSLDITGESKAKIRKVIEKMQSEALASAANVTVDPPEPTEEEALMAEYGISRTFDGEKYRYGQWGYERLEDAIAHVRSQSEG